VAVEYGDVYCVQMEPTSLSLSSSNSSCWCCTDCIQSRRDRHSAAAAATAATASASSCIVVDDDDEEVLGEIPCNGLVQQYDLSDDRRMSDVAATRPWQADDASHYEDTSLDHVVYHMLIIIIIIRNLSSAIMPLVRRLQRRWRHR